MRYIQGHNRQQETMFPAVMDDYIADDNSVRFIDAYVDTLDIVELDLSHSIPETTGRKPYNPGDLLKLYIYGYLHKIRSSRRLEDETHRNLELIWLLRALKPDFKTIADFRKDNPKAIKQTCRDFVLYCKELGLFALELIAIDGSKFAAVNHSRKAFSKNTLKKRIKELEQSIDGYFEEIEQNDKTENEISKPTVQELKEKIETLKSRKQTFEKYQDQLEKSGEKQIVLTDPDSRIMRTGRNGQDVCYNVQTAVDSKHNLIVDFDVTNEGNDLHQLNNMTSRVKEQFKLQSFKAVTDLGYFEKNEIKKCQENNIECYLPDGKKSQNHKQNLYTIKDFRYDRENDCYFCPANEKLNWTRVREHSGKKEKDYWTAACRNCEQKSKCTKAKDVRHIYRWEHEDIIDEMRQRVKEHPEIIAARRNMVEHPFGTIKHAMGFSYFLCKGLDMVKTEMSLGILAYNIKRVINIIGVKELLEIIAKRKRKPYQNDFSLSLPNFWLKFAL